MTSTSSLSRSRFRRSEGLAACSAVASGLSPRDWHCHLASVTKRGFRSAIALIVVCELAALAVQAFSMERRCLVRPTSRGGQVGAAYVV